MREYRLHTKHNTFCKFTFTDDGKIYGPGDVEMTPSILKYKLKTKSIRLLLFNKKDPLLYNAGRKICDAIL